MVLLKNNFQVIALEEDIFVFTWLDTSVYMKEEDYTECMENYAKLVAVHKPSGLLADNSNFAFPISPKLQDWTNETVFPVGWKSGVRRVGMVVAPELIPQLSVEQAMETRKGQQFVTRYFDNKAEAYKWLVS
ncbi:hypothetical protein R9C00_15955 [Flammeovirgaceae bacterium SG7u.111]|nr:hypothetical protein [Flammeovirgaceae bacterium SG7u.132]WPO33197.1 hypothetical protein R9C00_15955 [Flammeovirgaceae bacterium SG7u.111]